jgi:hypothetical protein
MVFGNQHRNRGDLIRDVQGLLVEAQEVISARFTAAQQLARVGRIDANLVAHLFQRPDRLLEMRKGRVGQAAEIDHISATLHVAFRALHDGVHGKRGGIDNLGEDLDVVFGHVGRLPRAAEKNGNVLQLVGPAQEGHAEALAQALQVGAAAAGQQDLVGLDRLWQPPRDDLLGHERRHLDADIEHLPAEARIHALKHGLEPRPRQMSGQEQDAFSHRGRALELACPF